MKSRTTVNTRLRVEPLEDRWVPVAPVNSVPGTQIVVIDGTLGLSAANANGLSVTDPDGPGPFEVEVDATKVDTAGPAVGTLSLGTTTGLTVTGNGTASLVLIGDLVNINAALDTLSYHPAAGFSGQARIVFESDDQNGAGGLSDTDFFVVNVVPPALTPSVTNATTDEDAQTTSGLVISRNAGNGTEVTHFKITTIQNGTLFLNNGTTPVTNGSFLTFAQGNAGLKFTPAPNFFGTGSFGVQASLSNTNAGLGGGVATATVNVNAQPDTPSVTDATTDSNTQTTSGLVISRNAVDGSEVTHFKITNVVNGTLFLNDGTTQVTDGTFITFAQGNAGLKFTPDTNFSGTGSFDAQASTSNSDAGLGGGVATATISVGSPPTISIGDVTLVEGNAGTTAFVFTVTLSSASATPVTVDFTTQDGTATVADGDYVANAGTLTFTPNTTTRTITVLVNGDTKFEPTEAFQVLLSNATGGATFADANATGTITEDDNAAPVANPDSFTTAKATPLTVPAPGVLTNDTDTDGPAPTAVLVSDVANGVLVLNADGSFTYTPNPNFNGTDSFTYQVDDTAAADNLSNIVTVTLTVLALPTVGDIPNQAVSFGSAVGPVAFTVGDTETPAGLLALTATSNNPTLVANASIAFGGTGANRTVIVNPTTGQSGSATITVTVTDGDGLTATATFNVTVAEPSPAPPVNTDLFAVGSGPGITATVQVFNADGTLRFTLFPFANFTGGVAVATGDVTGDGIDDIAAATGPGAGPHVKLFDGATGAEIRSFFAYSPTFTDGVFVGLGDVNGDGRADIVTGAGAGGAPHVKVFDGQSLAEVFSFFAFDASARGGVTVRAGDVDGDGRADIVTGAGPGGGPHVKVFGGRDLSLLQSFFAGDPSDTGGVFVGVANLSGDARAEVVAGLGGRVKVFGAAAALLPYIEQDNLPSFDSGVRTSVAAIRLEDGIIAVLQGAAPRNRAPSHVKVIDPTSGTVRNSFFAFDPLFTGGVFVG